MCGEKLITDNSGNDSLMKGVDVKIPNSYYVSKGLFIMMSDVGAYSLIKNILTCLNISAFSLKVIESLKEMTRFLSTMPPLSIIALLYSFRRFLTTLKFTSRCNLVMSKALGRKTQNIWTLAIKLLGGVWVLRDYDHSGLLYSWGSFSAHLAWLQKTSPGADLWNIWQLHRERLEELSTQ